MSASRTELLELRPDVTIHSVVSQPHPPRSSRRPGLPTIVFLHFWGGSSRTWSLVNPLVSLKYPTVALDFRGWGNSVGPDDADAYSVADLAGDVESVITKLNLGAVVLVGLSMGAKVAQLVAARLSPDDGAATTLRGVILVSPAPATPLTLPPDMLAQQLRAYDNADSATFVATNVLTESFRSRELPAFVVQDMLRGTSWAREAWPAYAMAEDVSQVVGRIGAPILVLAAEKDAVEPLERVKREVHERIPGALLKVLPGSGHLSPLDAPEALAEHILQFMDGLTLNNVTGEGR